MASVGFEGEVFVAWVSVVNRACSGVQGCPGLGWAGRAGCAGDSVSAPHCLTLLPVLRYMSPQTPP